MKAQLNTSRTIPFFDASAEVGAEAFVLQVLDSSGGVELAVLQMNQVVTAPNLYLSDPFAPEVPGQYQLRFKYGDVPVVIQADTLEVGAAPISDFPLGAEVDIVLESSIVGGVGQTITAHIYDSSGNTTASTSYASYTGDQALQTFPISNNDQIVIQIFPDGGGTGPQTVVFLCAAAEVTGGVGNFVLGLGTDIATYQIDSLDPRQIDLTGVAATQTAYMAALNAQIKGAYVSDAGGGKLKITTDSQGSDSQIVLSNFGATFAANTGFVEGTYVSNPVLNNVGNSDDVTFFELKLLIETSVTNGVQGDRVLATLESGTNYLVLTATNGSPGATSHIDLQSGTASLLASLGLSGLGSQGGNLIAKGSDGVAIQALYSSAVDGYVVQNLTFSTAQEIYVVWLDGGVQTYLTHYLLTKEADTQAVQITAGRLSGFNGNPHIGATVTVSTFAGVQVAQGVTDVVGDLLLDIPAGDYVFTLTKAGNAFTTNNFEYEVFNSSIVPADPNLFSETGDSDVQAIQLVTEVFEPTVTSPPLPASMCTLYATLYHMDGTPVRHATVHVGLIHRPQLFSGTAVFDTQRVYKTDSNGYLEFSLVQGIQVDISIAPLSLRRRIEVPDNVGPVNLMTLLSGADDPFDVLIPNIISAPKRTL